MVKMYAEHILVENTTSTTSFTIFSLAMDTNYKILNTDSRNMDIGEQELVVIRALKLCINQTMLEL